MKPLSESQRAQLVRQKASVLPDVTVESLRLGDDKSLARFNIRTTEQDPEKVKNEILKAFGSSLARVEMTYSEGKPIAARRAAGGRRGQDGADAPARRFAGGREYELDIQHDGFQQHADRPRRSSRPCSPRSSKRPRSPIPTSRFEITADRRRSTGGDQRHGGGNQADPPHRPRARRRQDRARASSRTPWPTTPTCSSSGSPISAAPSPARPARSP